MEIGVPKISIIVPIYNVEQYLSKCIDSILNQTFEDFELILVNDGSTDQCLSICRYYEKRDNRIKVISKRNGGLSSARNAGLDVAQGEYVSFIDSDDYIKDNMYEVLLDYIQKHNADIVICDYFLVDENSGEVKKDLIQYEISKVRLLNNTDSLYELHQYVTYYNVAWNKLYRRSMFEGIRYPEGLIYEDEYIAHQILFKANKVVCIPEVLYFYLQRKTSILGASSNIKKADKLLAKLDRIKFYKKQKLTNLMYRANKDFVDLYFWNYKCIEKEVEYSHEKLKEMRKLFRKNFILFSQGPYISFNQKLILVLFCVSPKLYYKFVKVV